jgi:hypothetical protein
MVGISQTLLMPEVSCRGESTPVGQEKGLSVSLNSHTGKQRLFVRHTTKGNTEWIKFSGVSIELSDCYLEALN